MTMEHLRPLRGRREGIAFILLDGGAVATSESASRPCEPCARTARLTALSKSDGRVTGIVAVGRRSQTGGTEDLPAVGSRLERPWNTCAHVVAMMTTAGCECVAHVLQGLTELDPEATVTSIDGMWERLT